MVDFNQGKGDPFSSVIVDNSNNNTPADPTPPVEENPPVVGDQLTAEPSETKTEDQVETGTPPEPPERKMSGGDDVVDDEPPSREEEPPSEPTEVPSEEEADVNPYFYLAEELHKDGFIPEDLELSNDIDGMTVYNAYKQKLKADAEVQVRQEVMQALQSEGFNDHDLILARAIREGVDLRLLSEASMYEMYANMPEEVDTNQKQDAIRQMYRNRGLEDNEIDTLLSNASADENVDELFNQSRQYFNNKYSQWRQTEEQRSQQLREQAKQQADQVNQLIKNVIQSQRVMGEEFTPAQAKELEEAIYTPNVTFEAGGNTVKGTELQKFLYEWETNPELKLYLFKKYKFREQETENIKRKVKREVEEDFLKGYKTKVLQDKKRSKGASVKKQLDDVKSAKGRSFMVDLSNPNN